MRVLQTGPREIYARLHKAGIPAGSTAIAAEISGDAVWAIFVQKREIRAAVREAVRKMGGKHRGWPMRVR